MQGLRARTVQQDENHGQTFLGAKSYADNLPENAPGSVRATPMAGMPLNRRALGNITNRGLNNSNIHTEKTPLQRPGATKGLGNPEVGSTKPSRTKAQPDTQTAQNADRIAALAADGVEKLYGKGWEELERDGEFREDEEILQRVSAMSSVGLPTYFPLWVRTAAFFIQTILLAIMLLVTDIPDACAG